VTDSTPTKTCTKCGRELPISRFGRHRSTRDGFDSQCKDCKAAYHRAWAAKNAERVKEYRKRHYQDNRQAYLERAQKRKGVNPLGRGRFPRAADGWKFCTHCHYMLPLEEFYRDSKAPDRRTARCRDCSNALRYNLMTRAARARARAGDGLDFTATDILRIYKSQRGRCRYCSQPLRKRFALDHVVPIAKGGGNEPGNVVVACLQCNYLKADLDVEEFRARHLMAS